MPPPVDDLTNQTDHPERSVNQLIADLRKTSVKSRGQSADTHSAIASPSVPPDIRRILQIPETPAPVPRRVPRFGPNGRRLPPGPPAPRSWSSPGTRNASSPYQYASGGRVAEDSRVHGLPGAFLPSRGSLMDLLLRKFVADWEFQRSYCRYYLYELPNHLKVALITHLGMWYGGVSISDLRDILLPPPDIEEDPDEPPPSPSSVNESITHLDLSGSLNRSLRIRELSDLLFPPTLDASEASNPQESWDAPDDSIPAIPRPLLPNLTHLSLAITPGHAQSVSWRHLLSFSSHLPTLTHLSLAYWPDPSLTPNARLATVVSSQAGGRAVPYSGTGIYSHSLDDDWSEAVGLLRRLSRNLYGLEYLDLTGCDSWFPALMAVADHDGIDWVREWGKLERILLYPGYRPERLELQSEKEKYVEAIDVAGRVERHIRSRRAGKGRRIHVETDAKPGGLGLGSMIVA